MMVWHKDAAQTANVQTEVLNRNGEMFFTLHVALVTLVCHLQVWYICLKTGAEN